MAVVAAVMFEVVLLQAFGAAGRANAALVEPVAVGVQAVLNVIFVDTDADIAR